MTLAPALPLRRARDSRRRCVAGSVVVVSFVVEQCKFLGVRPKSRRGITLLRIPPRPLDLSGDGAGKATSSIAHGCARRRDSRAHLRTCASSRQAPVRGGLRSLEERAQGARRILLYLKPPHDDDDAYANTSDGWARPVRRRETMTMPRAQGSRAVAFSRCERCAGRSPTRGDQGLRNHAHLVNLCMFEGNAGDYRLRLRPHQGHAIAAPSARSAGECHSSVPREWCSASRLLISRTRGSSENTAEAALLSDALCAAERSTAKVVIAGFTARPLPLHRIRDIHGFGR